LPAGHEGLHHVGRLLAGHGGQGDSVAMGIHEMDPIEPHSTPKIAGPHQVHLVHDVGTRGSQSGIGGATELGRWLAHQAVPLKDPRDGPKLGQGLDAQLLELLLNGVGAALRIPGLDQPYSSPPFGG
jgi:hypothetical protein